MSLNISITSAGGATPSSLQWTLGYSAADIRSVTFATGAAGFLAGKSVTCIGNNCLLYGFNTNGIPDGVVAVALVRIAPTTLATSIPIQITGLLASTGSGNAIPLSGINGVIQVNQSAPPALSQLTCTPSSVQAPVSSSCTISITGTAPAGGFSASLSSNSAALSIPATVTISPGTHSATFIAMAGAIASDHTATVTASANGVSSTASITLLARAQLSALVTGYNLSNAALRNDFSGWVGMRFTVGAFPLNVVSLGRVCVPGNSGVHAVKFVDASTGMDVLGGAASLNLAGCPPGQFFYATLSRPISLRAGAAYYLISQEVLGRDEWYDSGTVSTNSVAAVNSAIYSPNGVNWIPVGSTNLSYVPPNFRYVTPSGINAISVSIQTNPPGLSFAVDGVSYQGTQTFTWTAGSPHAIAAKALQSGGTGMQYVWSNWSDNGALAHSVAPTTSTLFTANFVTQYLLTTNAVPVGSGTITANPSSVTGFYDSGTAVQLTATANTGYTFSNWSGDLTGSANAQTVTLSGPRSVGASFKSVSPNNFVTGYALNPPPVRGDGGGWAGMKFTVGSAPLSVMSLGRICILGNLGTSILKLVDASNGTDVPGGSVLLNLSACSHGQFVYGFLANPVTLRASTSYYLVSQLGGNLLYESGAISTTSVAAVNAAVYSPDGINWIAGSSANASYLPPDFQYSLLSPDPQTAFITSLGVSKPPVRNNFSGWVGMKFTVGSNPLNVTSVGRICVAGNASTHAVKFVSVSTGLDVAGTAVSLKMSGCAPGQFFYAPLPNAITLQPGSSYYLVSQESLGGDQWYDYGTISSSNVAQLNNAIYSTDGGTWIPALGPDTSYVPANFQYTQTPPSSHPFVTGYNLNGRPSRSDFDGWVGMTLIVGADPIPVASLGRVCIAGNSAIHTVKFVNASTGLDVPGGSTVLNLSGCEPGQFQYALLPNPIALQPGGSYYLVSQELLGGDQWYDWGSVSTTTAATVTSAVYSNGANWIPIGDSNSSCVPPNFK